MPVAGSDSSARAEAHFRWAERYTRESNHHKAAAHFGRAMEYKRRAETNTNSDKHRPNNNKDTVHRNRAASGRLLFGAAEPVTINWIQPPSELVRAGRMSTLVVSISQLDTTEQLTVKATCIYMNRQEKPELEVVVEMRVVQLDSLDYKRLIGMMYPGFPLDGFSHLNSRKNPHHKLVTQGVNANTDRALGDLKTKSAGPVAIVTNITTTMHSSAGADAQAEGLGLRVLHSILSNAEFKLATKLNDDSFVVMSTDPADAAGQPLPMTLSETGHPLDRSVRLDQLRCYGFEVEDSTDFYITSIVRAKLRSIGASGMPLPSGFLSVIRMAQTDARIPQLGVRSGGLIRIEADGSCIVNAVITLPYNLEIPVTEMPFLFSDAATGAVIHSARAVGILQEMIRWFYEQDRRTKRKLLDGRAGDELDRGVLAPLEVLTRRLSNSEEYATPTPLVSEAPVPASVGKRSMEVDSNRESPMQWTDAVELVTTARSKTFTVCKTGERKYVLKTQEDSQSYRSEVQALRELQSTGCVPKLHAVWVYSGRGHLVIDMLVPVTTRTDAEIIEVWSELGSILRQIRELGWLHVDTHGDNVMRTGGGRLVLIDFGLAVKKLEDGGTDATEYPDHYLSHHYAMPLTWRQLGVIQEYKYQANFNPAIVVAYEREPTKQQEAAIDRAYTEYWGMMRRIQSGNATREVDIETDNPLMKRVAVERSSVREMRRIQGVIKEHGVLAGLTLEFTGYVTVALSAGGSTKSGTSRWDDRYPLDIFQDLFYLVPKLARELKVDEKQIAEMSAALRASELKLRRPEMSGELSAKLSRTSGAFRDPREQAH
jgi:tRNA A-37 threonylcarbamoyl transferase component Bud32